MAPRAFDLIVLGAGPAGASAAVEARRLGLSVALVDKARFPRDKLCGGGVTGRAQAALAGVFGALPRDLFHDVRHVRLMAGARVIGDHPDAPVLAMTMRRAFDAELVGRALAAGAADFTGRRAALELPAVAMTLGDGTGLTARALIGADGVNSAVAKALFGRAFDPKEIGFALETEVPGPPEAAAELDLAAAAWGYGWAFPKAGGTTVGVGGVAGRNADLRPAMEAYLARHGGAGLKVKGHHLPFGDARPDPARGAVLLAGDAAGFVDPLTGEGIGWAVTSGQLAAQAVAAALAEGRPEGAGPRYLAATAHLRGELARARRLRALVYHPWLRARCIDLLARDMRLQRRFLALLAGEMDYADLRPARVLRHLARMVLRA
ncbi:geranylgeranyl reductase family protein [Neotabrizicola shimadae]|uniref:Geranylgeranyl reductase family protein n=1 Tax=Neotabrizicola shimadae TaxID=2807096 RepID=A0A8G1EE37_9RHOB|nr:geranylgeranyl reductase family protein [Neotabrizicola shimadae]QYZ70094.1 geranylgeranyl reductase family protein [Neotabrizicola shimadae]